MRVFKFGGASVKNAEMVKNIAHILAKQQDKDILIVISAIGKTTNTLEALCHSFFYGKDDALQILEKIKNFHFDIINELFGQDFQKIAEDISNMFVEIEWILEEPANENCDFVYDQIVSIGELVSSRIAFAYLKKAGLNLKWLDARNYVRTDNTYREGKVDWERSSKLIQKDIPSILQNQMAITQGFIGCTSENYTTTLGREGSDYSAAIFAYALDAESVSIWKDVPGVLNADPKRFDHTVKIDRLSYQDAIELAYYGATVIHPKTIKPLQNKGIPLFVRPFMEPDQEGTLISEERTPLPIPFFISKKDQVLLSIFPLDFSFIAEENLSDIFHIFSIHGVRINTMFNSAISFSVCIDHQPKKLEDLIQALHIKYKTLYNTEAELITIRHYDQGTIDQLLVDKLLLLEVKSRYTIQMVVKNQNERDR